MSARRRLGRGLDALISTPATPAPSEEKAETESRSPSRLPVKKLKPNRFQPRTEFSEAGLEELSESIRHQGIVQPIVVSPRPDGDFTIVAGERRWRAAQRAGLEEVPVAIREVEGDQEMLELALVENIQRTDLNPIEEAEAYRTLQDSFSLSQEAVAKRVGKARTTVTNALRLLRLAPEVQDLLREGQLTAGQARPLISLSDPDEQVALARRALEEGLSARDLERLISEPKKETKKPAPEPPDVHTSQAQEKLTQRMQTRVEIKRRGKGGSVNIHFHSEEELMRVYDQLMDVDP